MDRLKYLHLFEMLTMFLVVGNDIRPVNSACITTTNLVRQTSGNGHTWATNYVGPLYSGSFEDTASNKVVGWVIYFTSGYSIIAIRADDCGTPSSDDHLKFSASCSISGNSVSLSISATAPLTTAIVKLEVIASGTSCVDLTTFISVQDCGRPDLTGVEPPPANSVYGDSHTFTCNANHSGEAVNATCKADATWSLTNHTLCSIKVTDFWISPRPIQVVGGYVYFDISLANTNFQINFVINGDIAYKCRYNVSSTCECTPRNGSIYNNRTYVSDCWVHSHKVYTYFDLYSLTLMDKSISVTTIDGFSLANANLDVQYCGNVTSDGIIQDVPAHKEYNSRHNFTCMSGYTGMDLQPYCDHNSQWRRTPLCIFVKVPLTLATSPNGFLPGSNITASISFVTNSTGFRFNWIISNIVVGNCYWYRCHQYSSSVYKSQVSLTFVRNDSLVELSMRFQSNASSASYNISLQGYYDSTSFGYLEFSTASCGNPSQAGVSAAPANSGFGASHTFTCTPGYTGTATGLSTCQADGVWSLDGIPTCTASADVTATTIVPVNNLLIDNGDVALGATNIVFQSTLDSSLYLQCSWRYESVVYDFFPVTTQVCTATPADSVATTACNVAAGSTTLTTTITILGPVTSNITLGLVCNAVAAGSFNSAFNLQAKYCGNVVQTGVVQNVAANQGFSSTHTFTCMSGYTGTNPQSTCGINAQWSTAPTCNADPPF